jgi:hypothetical protein
VTRMTKVTRVTRVVAPLPLRGISPEGENVHIIFEDSLFNT